SLLEESVLINLDEHLFVSINSSEQVTAPCKGLGRVSARPSRDIAMAVKKHVVMFPYMAQGHLIPFLKLAKLLASQGLTVSFITTTMSASKLQSKAVGSDIRFIPLSFPYIDGLTPGCETVDSLTSVDERILLFCSSHRLSVPFEEWLQQVTAEISAKPVCIISDVFLAWTADSASRFGIPLVVFHTTGAMGASLMQYLFTNPVAELISGDDDGGTVEIHDRSLNVNLSKSLLVEIFKNESYPQDLLRLFETRQRKLAAIAKERCAATLVNTLDQIEEGYLRYLHESTGKPVWAIASPPLHKPQKGICDESECMSWLDSQKQNSVLYVSFGSQVFLSEGQIKALARGIEASKQPFIWTIKDSIGSNVNSCDFLPEGFAEATRDRGLLIHGWAPQLQILSHPSTACFLSHSGWNSTLESISAGVPMVVWPMVLDQLINAKLVVEQLKIGLQICQGWDRIPCSDTVEFMVKSVMVKETGNEMRNRAENIKTKIEGASNELNIRGFVSYILNLRRHGD
ncbi:hypothetical protein KI387_027528, partial [Taxus chinensis]